MNAIGVVLLWCVIQITLVGLAAGLLYGLARRLRPAAAAPIVLSGLVAVLVLSLMAPSPWPRWNLPHPARSAAASPLPQAGEASKVRADGPQFGPPQTETESLTPASDQHHAALSQQGTRPWTDATWAEAPPQPDASLPPSPHPTRLPSAGDGAGARNRRPEPTSPATQPSATAVLWETIAKELSIQRAAAGDSRRWPTVVAVLLLSAMIVGLAWFALGVAAVGWQKRQSRPVTDRSALALVGDLSTELGCRRKIELRQCDDLVTAATIGWRRPVILLPGGWRGWTADQRRAVLAHEIAHARSHDFLALLFGQLALVLHFYHPLVHLLMNRLRLEQELAADAAAAGVSGGQRRYLATIAELALRKSDRPMLWPARTFLPTRTTFLRRIAVLRDSKLRTDRLRPAARLATVGAVLICGLMVAGFRGSSPFGLAKADDSKAASGSSGEPGAPFQAQLSGGITVELLGVSENPSAGKPWWRPDGSSLPDRPYKALDGNTVDTRPHLAREFAILLHDVPSQHVDTLVECEPTAGAVSYHTLENAAEDGQALRAVAVSLPVRPTATVRIGVAQGSWQTVCECSPDSVAGLPEAGVMFSEVTEKDGQLRITVTHDIMGDQARVIAYGQGREELLPSASAGQTAGGFRQITATFDGLAPDEATTFALQTRPYEWVAFRNVSLEPGRRTNVEVALCEGPIPVSEKPETGDTIVEGVGWGPIRIGMDRKELLAASGKPDDTSSPNWLKWQDKHIECTFHKGDRGVSEVRFNRGFQGALENGIKVGSPDGGILKLYGKPEHTIERSNGATEYVYSSKGVLFWTYQGKVTQIVVFKPYGPGVAQAAAEAEASSAEASPSAAKQNRTVLSHVGESSTNMRSFADSGFAEQFERPAGAKSIVAVQVFASRYGDPDPPDEDFHVYLLDEEQKVLEEIRVPYGKVERGDMRWYSFDFPAVAIPESFYVALWFDAERTKGVYVGLDKSVKESHSWIGLPDRGFNKVEENYDWMIRAVVSDEEGHAPSRPRVTTYGEEKAADTESIETLPARAWTDSTGVFRLEAKFAGVENGKVRLEKVDGTTVELPLENLSEKDREFVAEQESEAPLGPSRELSHDDGSMASRSSIAGGGHAVEFEVDGDSWYVTSLSLHGSRYGEARPPQEDFHAWICDDQFKPIARFDFPYASFTRSEAVWKTFRVRPTRVPSKFIVCFAFNPHRTKGVMVSYDAESSGHSLVGVPEEREPRPFESGDWLIRCTVSKRLPEKEAPAEIDSDVTDRPPSAAKRESSDSAAARPATGEDLTRLERLANAATRPAAVHIVAKMRTAPQDNFSFIDAESDFVPVEIWQQFGEQPKWRVEKPERVAVMDGRSTVMLIRQETAVKLAKVAGDAFDTWWLLALADTKRIIDSELRPALTKGWTVQIQQRTWMAGEVRGRDVLRVGRRVIVEAQSGLPDGDYTKNKFYHTSDMRREYVFDEETGRLVEMKAYLHQPGGDVLVFATERIDYDRPTGPETFELPLSEVVNLYQPPQRLPDNEKYEKMTPQEAARAFFEACEKKNWLEAGKFYQGFTDRTKSYLGGLEIVQLGEPFQSEGYPGWFVPYEIKLPRGSVKKHNLAVRNDNPANRYIVDGGL